MHRRSFLTLAGTGLLAGCSSSDSDGGDGGGATTPQTDTEPTPEPTTPDAATETATAASATFTVVSITGPDEVRLGESHNIEITARNTGDVAGTFRPTLRVTTSRTTDWREIEVEIGPIEPGETETLTSNDITFDEPQEIQYEIKGSDVSYTYQVVAPQATLEVGRSGLVEADVGYETRQMAEVAVTNTGDAIAGWAEVTVDWLDDSGDYLASTTANLRGLQAGETWLARADPQIDVDNNDAIADFEVSPGQARPTAAIGPEGVPIVDSQHRASESEVLVRATARNDRDSALDYLAFVGKVYNDADEVIGHYYTNETDIAAGAAVRFEGNPDTNGRNGAVSGHEALLTTSTL